MEEYGLNGYKTYGPNYELKVGHYYQTVIHKIKVLSISKYHHDKGIEVWYFVKRSGIGRGTCQKKNCPFMRTGLVHKYKCNEANSPYMCGTLKQIGYHREIPKLKGILELGE